MRILQNIEKYLLQNANNLSYSYIFYFKKCII